MNAYFVLGIITAIWAVGLAAVGLTRENFPGSGQGLRVIVGVTLLLVGGTLVALMATTQKEHPRQEAEAEAAKAETQPAGGAGGKISAEENEYDIDLSVGDTLTAGRYTFEVSNGGRVEHDLAVQGDGVKEKTALIKPGGQASLPVDLAAGDYKVYCTVPGHEQAGMKVDLTVQ